MTVAMNKEEGLKYNQTCTGRILAVKSVPQLSLARIVFADGKGGNLPDKYSGVYTCAKYAQAALSQFVAETWDAVASKIKK